MDSKKLHLVAVLVQVIYAGMFLLSKAALNSGINCFVFTFYRQATATVFLLPAALIHERKGLPSVSWAVILQMFVLALVGITTSLNMYGVALGYTSSTFAAAATNTLPAITFTLAVLLRKEVVNVRKVPGRVKVLGIIVCLAGAAVIAFYKGPHLNPFHHHHHHHHQKQQADVGSRMEANKGAHSTEMTWIRGVFVMLASNLFWGMWLVLQGEVLKNFPSKLLFTAIQCLFSSIQCFFVALAFGGGLSSWKLGMDVNLVAILYSGIFVTGLTYYLQAWCIDKKGPVFLAVFTPLSLVITMICSVSLLGEQISLGSVLGGILMVGSLYFVLWGKSREEIDGKATVEENKNCEEKTGTLEMA